MERRRFLAKVALGLGALKERLDAATSHDRNIRWAVSSFLWTSTQWKDDGSAKFTDMLDVIKDCGLDGFRLNGWPRTLERFKMPQPVLEKELSKRGLRLATLSFGGQADDASQHKAIEANAHEACKFLKSFGSDVLTVFAPRRPNKVLVRQHMKVACELWNRIGDVCAGYGIRAGQHNHSQGQLVENQDEVELMLRLTDPKRFHWSPDTVHLYLGGCDIYHLFEKHGHRLISMDYVDAKYVYAAKDVIAANGAVEKAGAQNTTFLLCNQDMGDGEIDFRRLHRVLKRNRFKGWITIDHHYTPVSPRHSFTRCKAYIREKLDPIYR
ncbi:MAG: TIM barrel protein [Candidatus Solibacter usitatus]|nr:TIM barrel protein [Candidatus Solibacter usitatus]